MDFETESRLETVRKLVSQSRKDRRAIVASGAETPNEEALGEAIQSLEEAVETLTAIVTRHLQWHR